MKPESLCFSTRLVVTLNATFAFFTIYLIRVQFSISIICMVKDPDPIKPIVDNITNSSFKNSYDEHRFITNVSYKDGVEAQLFEISAPNNVHNGTKNTKTKQHGITSSSDNFEGEFEWDKSLQGVMLTAFFWGYVVTQIPCGWLAVHYGARNVVSIGMFIANTAHMVTPLVARLHPYLVIGLRVIVGLGHGVMFPSLHSLFGNWAPPLERSMLMAPTYAGGIIASCLALGLTGLLCSAIGWANIFYIYGVVSYIWLGLWCYNVYSSPAYHPRISAEEKKYIQTAIGSSAHAKKVQIPWRSIFNSGPFWAIVVAHFCDNWGQYTVLTSAPIFMKEVLNFDLKTNGVLVALPYLVMYIITLISSQIADLLRRSHILSSTAVRKLYQAIGFIFPAIFMAAIGFVNCSQRSLAVTLLTLAVAFQAFCRSAYSINHVDIAPRFSGLLCGISNTFATIPGMIAPYLAAKLTPNGSHDEWRLVFFICSGIFIFGLVIYLLLASGEEQEWAKPKQSDRTVELEIPLNQSINTRDKDVSTQQSVEI